MTTTALLFEWPAPASTALVFGTTLVPSGDLSLVGTLPALTAHLVFVPPAEISLYAELPALTALVIAIPSTNATLVATLPALTAAMSSSYRSNTDRPTVATAHTAAKSGAALQTGVTQPGQHAQTTSHPVASPGTAAAPLSHALPTGFANASPMHTPGAAVFQDAAQRPALTMQASMQEGDRQWLRFFSAFQEADRQEAGRLQGQFEDGLRDRRSAVHTRFQDARPRPGLHYHAHIWPAVPTPIYWPAPFQQAMVPPPGQWVQTPITPIPVPTYWGTALLFQCPPLLFPSLVFGGTTPCDVPVDPSHGATLYILPARYYMTAHTIVAHRLPDLTEVPIYDATVSADSGSYCWTLSASGPADLFTLLAPSNGAPVSLRVTLDGIPFVFAIDALSRNHSFGKTGVNVSGRSVTALIGAPYMRSETRIEPDQKTAEQLAGKDDLGGALFGTGVDMDWGTSNGGLISWLVPPGAYSRQGTPLEAVSRIVQAAGGYLQSHRSLPRLLARHPYGLRGSTELGAPWYWGQGTPDVELAPDAIITEAIERKDGPDINAVWVSGTTHGVLAQVKRSETAADKLAPMVTDSLITDVIAARQRGLSILGAAGPKHLVRLDLPVLTGIGQPGVLDVGQLVEITATVPWRARVRGVSVSAKQPTLRQSVTLERHL